MQRRDPWREGERARREDLIPHMDLLLGFALIRSEKLHTDCLFTARVSPALERLSHRSEAQVKIIPHFIWGFFFLFLIKEKS